MCVLDLPSDYIFLWMHSNQPTVPSIYIFDTVQNAFQLVDFTGQHYFARTLLYSGLGMVNIRATKNLSSELSCFCQAGKVRLSCAPVGNARRTRVLQHRLTGHGSFTTVALPDRAGQHPGPGRGSSMGEQSCGARLQLMASSWERRLSSACSRSSLPCPPGGHKVSAEWGLELSSAGM